MYDGFGRKDAEGRSVVGLEIKKVETFGLSYWKPKRLDLII